MKTFDLAMELDLFLKYVDLSFTEYAVEEFPMLSKRDVELWTDRMRSEKAINCSDMFSGGFEPLIRSAMAHFLYHMKYYRVEEKTPELISYHPNFIRFTFMDKLIESKQSLLMGAFTTYEFSPGTSPIDKTILMLQINEIVHNHKLVSLIERLVLNLQKEGSQIDRIVGFVQSKKKHHRGIGWIYFILIDIYLPMIDRYIAEIIQKNNLTCFWERSLNTAIICSADRKTMLKSRELLDLDNILPAWGLRAKVRSGYQGGRVVRLWNGALFISKEAKLQWKRPDSIVS